MNAIDIIISVLFIASVGYGIWKGLIMEIFSLASVVLAFLGANYGHGYLSPLILEYVSVPGIEKLLAYCIIFAVIMISVTTCGILLRKVVHGLWMGWIDRLGGGALGIVKAGAVSIILVGMATAFLPKDNPTLQTSLFVPQFLLAADYMIQLAPAELLQTFQEKRKMWKIPLPGSNTEEQATPATTPQAKGTRT